MQLRRTRKTWIIDVFKDYIIIERSIVIITKDYESIVYTGFHYGRYAIDK